jgi:hypothetical protein
MRTNCRKTIRLIKRAEKVSNNSDIAIEVSKEIYERYKKGYENSKNQSRK